MGLTQVNSGGIEDGSIVNADIKSDSAIALSKLASTPAVLTGSTDNTIATVTGANAIQGEANLTYDGTTLKNTVAAENGTIAQFELSGQTNNPALLIKADESDQQITFRAGSSTSTYPSIAFDMGTVGDAVTIDSSGSVGIGTDSPGQLLSLKNTSAQCQQSLTAATNGSCAIYFGDTDSVNRSVIYHHNTDDYLAFYTAGSERLRILSGGGLTFNGDTSASNALNDYEYGTFTPLLVGYWSGSWRTTTRDGSMYATYTKVGRLCHVQVYFNAYQITGNGVGTYAAIWDLPFTAASNSTYGILNVSHSNAFSNCNAGNFYVSQGQSYALSSQYGDNDYDYCTWSGDDTRYLMFSGTYETT